MKNKKQYLYTGLVSLCIMAFVFVIKGIFPFGNNSVLIGDLHDQITPMYYHLHDVFYSNKSLLVDYTTSGGINFIGILAYYIISPFSILALLVPREYIYLIMPTMVAFKVTACSITCLYFLRKYFKNIPSFLQSLLAIIYAFSGYSLIMYQITAWIDAMYMLPLVIIGLKKLLDLEKPTYYIVTLSLSLIFSFYVTVMTLMFIFLASFIYIYVYKDKEDRKKIILSLGLATMLSVLISLFIIVPAYLEITESSRIGFKLVTLLNSKTGPLSDKLSMITFGGVVYAGLILLIKNYKENSKFLKFYIPTLLIMLIPLIIEPVNKVFHFGTYASFPYRNGFIMMFLMILGAAYAFNNYKEDNKPGLQINKFAAIFTAIASCIIIVRFSLRYYDRFQKVIYRLSISFDSKLILVLIITTIIATIASLAIISLNKNLSKFTLLLLGLVSVIHITTNTYIYIANDTHQDELNDQYKMLNRVSEKYEKNDPYRIKNNISGLVTNNGMVMKYNTLEHFTSLTRKNNLYAIKKLGFGTEWVKTRSSGSNLFIDYIMGNRYILSDKKMNNSFYKQLDNMDGYRLYELDNKSTFGVLLNRNDKILDKSNSFEIANSLYKNITDSSDNLFSIDNVFINDNVKGTTLKNGLINYEIIDKDYYAYFEKDVIVTDKTELYLEVVHSINNDQNFRINDAFDLYINNQLFEKNAFTETKNGVIDLGTFENKRVNIKLELKKDVILKELVVGGMNINKYNEFIDNYSQDTNIKYNKNKISLTIKNDSDKEKILFLPIVNDGSYSAKVNGKSVDVLKVYDNYIGIKVSPGENNIKLTYMPKAFIPTLIISLITLIITIVLIKFKLYDKIIENNILQNIAYYLYLAIYVVFVVIVYVGLTLCFLLSYIKYISV